MPRRITAEEASKLGAVPVEEQPAPARRRITAEEAAKLGATPVDQPAGYAGDIGPDETPEQAAKRMGGTFMSPDQVGAKLDEAGRMSLKEGIAKPVIAATQGALSNFGDELAAATETVTKAGKNHRFGMVGAVLDPETRLLESYRRNKGDWQAITDESTKDNSIPYLLGALASPNPAGKAGILGRLLAAGAQGVAGAVGDSRHSLADGDVGGVAKDAAVGGVFGLGAGAVGEALAAPMRLIGRGAGVRAGEAAEAQRALNQTAADKAIKTEVGNLGRNTASQGNAMESILEGAYPRGPVGDEAHQAATEFVNSEAGRKLIDRSILNNVSKGGSLLSEEEAIRLALAQRKAAATPEAIAAATAKDLDSGGVAKDLLGKWARSHGQRIALGAAGAAAGAGVAQLTGQDKSTGAVMGGLLSPAAPGALQFLRNQAGSPKVQHLALKTLQGLAEKGSNVTGKAAVGAARLAGSKPAVSPDEEKAIRAFLTGG